MLAIGYLLQLSAFYPITYIVFHWKYLPKTTIPSCGIIKIIIDSDVLTALSVNLEPPLVLFDEIPGFVPS